MLFHCKCYYFCISRQEQFLFPEGHVEGQQEKQRVLENWSGGSRECCDLFIGITPPKTNGWRAPKWWFGKGNSLKEWQFLVSMLDFWGVYRSVMVCLKNFLDYNKPWGNDWPLDYRIVLVSGLYLLGHVFMKSQTSQEPFFGFSLESCTWHPLMHALATCAVGTSCIGTV